MPVERTQIVRRTSWVVYALLLLLVAVPVKVAWIQIVKGDEYRRRAEQVIQRIDTIRANKGSVYASDGSLLATSMFRYEIRMDVMTVNPDTLRKHLPALARGLSRILGKPASYYEEKIRKGRKMKSQYLFIASGLNYLEYNAIRQLPLFNKGPYRGGLIAIQKTYRAHPLGKIASRLIGYDDYRGRPGIEGAFHKYLRGKDGFRLQQKIAKGQWKPLNSDNELEPIDGMDVITTLDINIQDVAHQALLEQLKKHDAGHGSVVVMHVKTGEIRAMSNLTRNDEGAYYEEYNYAVGEAHEPGSAFKLMTLVAALEDKVVDTSKVYDTGDGKWKIHGEWVRDSHEGGYGRISLARATELSSNVAYAKMITEAYGDNPGAFIRRLHKMHVDEPLGLPLKGEGTPVLTTPGSEHWSGTSLPWLSFGYGVKMTPLQILTFYNAIANGGKMVKPKFVKEITGNGNRKKINFKTEVIDEQICSPETVSQVKEILKNVVRRGTANNIRLPGYSLAGKTGTCKAEYWTDHMYYISSFTGFFPVENPEYSCIVVIHKPVKNGFYGNVVAAPVFRKIARKIYSATPEEVYLTQEPAFQKLEKEYSRYDAILARPAAVIPNVKGMPGMDAVSILENMGLQVEFNGTGVVKSQQPEPGTPLKKTHVVKLIMS